MARPTLARSILAGSTVASSTLPRSTLASSMLPAWLAAFILVPTLPPTQALAQGYVDGSGTVRVVVVADPYSDTRTGPELVEGPGLLLGGGLLDRLEEMGCQVVNTTTIRMPPHMEREYGEWNRASLTNRVLGKTLYASDEGEHFFVGLLSGSKSLVGMLAGLQHLGPDRAPLQDTRGRDILGLPRLEGSSPLRVGLVWISERGDFNTPDTSLEGDMGGMNVAVAAGRSNSMLRKQAGLDPPLSTKQIVMMGVRDTNPYEQLAIDNSFIETVSAAEMRENPGAVEAQMERLSGLTDVIYVHVDLSILSSEEMPRLPSSRPDGLSSRELAPVLVRLFAFPKAAAVGIAGLPNDAGPESIGAAYRLIEGVLEGVRSR